VVAASLAVATVALPGDAHATDVELEVALGAGGAWMRGLPKLTNEPLSTTSRELASRRLEVPGSVTAFGGYFEIGASVNDRFLVPLVGIGGYAAGGLYDPVVTSLDGSITRVRPWTTTRFDGLLPGFGYRVKQRRWMFGFAARAGFSVISVRGGVASGIGWDDLELTALSPLLQAELEACRRLDPVTRVCLQVAPRIYDGVFMNGATFGLRMEFGR